MTTVIAFDVYGTLIDTTGVATYLKELVGDRAEELTRRWRDKQLEYSFRRGLMQNFEDFSVCTRQALDFCCAELGIDLTEENRKLLLESYRTLPAFPDACAALPLLRQSGCHLYAFSNGRADDVLNLLQHAGIDQFFLDIVTTGEIKSFKPNPGVYAHFLRRAKASGHESWLISGNPFDVIGAISAGMRSAWVRRSPNKPFDPWEIQPTTTIASLKDLPSVIAPT